MHFVCVHLTLILGGFAGIILSVLSAGLYLVQSAQLKSKHPGRILVALPSLDRLDRMHFRALSFGLIFFSMGLLTGASRVSDFAGLLRAVKEPTVVFSMISCLLYWAVLIVRASALRRGHKIATATLLVFIFLVATILSGPHGRI